MSRALEYESSFCSRQGGTLIRLDCEWAKRMGNRIPLKPKMIRYQNDQVCDAREDDKRTNAGYKNF